MAEPAAPGPLSREATIAFSRASVSWCAPAGW
jgi:hypothetical protein